MKLYIRGKHGRGSLMLRAAAAAGKRSMAQQQVTIRHMTEDDISDVLSIDRALVGNRRVLTYADPVESYCGGNLAASWVAEIDDTLVRFPLCRVVEPGLGTIGGAWDRKNSLA
jgi:hypothetical protein